MRIDSHQHFWRYTPTDYPWMNADMLILQRDWLPDDLRPLLEQHRIDSCVAVQARASEAETDFLLMLATQHAWIAGVVGWVNLRAQNLLQRLDRWGEAPGLVGFRHQIQDESDVAAFVADPDVERGLKELQNRALAYDVLVHATQLKSIAPLCAACDDHWLVIDHLAKPAIRHDDHDTWRSDLQALAAMPHVVCKVSGLVTEALDATGEFHADKLRRYLDTALDLFGPQRLMFGSDWPVCLLATSYARVVAIVESWSARLSPSEHEALWSGTAQRAYSLT